MKHKNFNVFYNLRPFQSKQITKPKIDITESNFNAMSVYAGNYDMSRIF